MTMAEMFTEEVVLFTLCLVMFDDISFGVSHVSSEVEATRGAKWDTTPLTGNQMK